MENEFLELDNNASEQALRAVAIGGRSYLLAGADSGGQRAASLYSLLETGTPNGLDHSFYLPTVVAMIVEHPFYRIEALRR